MDNPCTSRSSMEENAYTADIPIKTIHVGNLSSEITEHEVKEYFLKFGSVAYVAMKRTDSKGAPCFYAYVTFEDAESATKALGLATHEILSRRVVVSPAGSWIQPKEECMRNEVLRDEVSEIEFRLLQLNEDCLYHIASYLELSDLLNLSKTCKRLECGLEPIFASYRKLDTKSLDGTTLMEKREILYKIGPHVQHIFCTTDFELSGRRFEELLKNVSLTFYHTCSLSKRLMQTFKNLQTLKCRISNDMSAVLPNCKNLQNLDLCDSQINILSNQYRSPGNHGLLKEIVDSLSKDFTCSLFMRLIESFKNLETLWCDVTDEMSVVLSNCSNLQKLDIYRSTKLTGKNLDKLSNLQNLSLRWCDNLQPEFFKNLCMKTKLVSLNIVGCKLLDYSSIETLASTQTKLETLSISNYYETSNLSSLATLKNLKRLCIDCFSKNCDEFFQELAKHRGAELEVLEIWGCPFYQKVEQAIYSLKKLKVLAVNRCENITSTFFTNMTKSSMECLAIETFEPIIEEGILNLISKSETIKVIVGDAFSLADTQRLVLSAHEIIKTKERKYPLSLFTSGPCIIDGIFYEEPELKAERDFRKIIRKLGYISQYNDFCIF